MKKNCYQQRKYYFIYEIFYVKFMLTTKVQNRDTKLKKRRLAIHQGKPPTYKGRQKQKKKKWRDKITRRQKTKKSMHI